MWMNPLPGYFNLTAAFHNFAIALYRDNVPTPEIKEIGLKSHIKLHMVPL